MSLFTITDRAEEMALFDRLDARVRRAAAAADVAYDPAFLMKQQRSLGSSALVEKIRKLEAKRARRSQMEMEAVPPVGEPLVGDLKDMAGYMNMASWLTRARDELIVLHYARLREILVAKGFAEAVASLDAQHVRALSTRAPDGTYQQHIQNTVYNAQIAMRIAAKARDRAAEGGGE